MKFDSLLYKKSDVTTSKHMLAKVSSPVSAVLGSLGLLLGREPTAINQLLNVIIYTCPLPGRHRRLPPRAPLSLITPYTVPMDVRVEMDYADWFVDYT